MIDNPLLLADTLERFAALPQAKILIHGGGKLATQLNAKLGIETQMHQGRRITTTDDLDVVTMVYAGLINKKVVSQLQALDCNAIGLSGCDANVIVSKKRDPNPVDFGFVGDVERVNAETIEALLTAQMTPVFCAITHDGEGQLLNTNADTISAEIARSLATAWDVELLYCFEKKGVLEDVTDENSVVEYIHTAKYHALKQEGKIHDGMLPKLDNCFYALEGGVSQVIIGDNNIINQRTICTKLTQ